MIEAIIQLNPNAGGVAVQLDAAMLPDGYQYRPGDTVTAVCSGRTITLTFDAWTAKQRAIDVVYEAYDRCPDCVKGHHAALCETHGAAMEAAEQITEETR